MKKKTKKIAVLVETEYIADELKYYEQFFKSKGFELDYMTYLWGEDQREIVSDVVTPGETPKTMIIKKEIAQAKLEDYAIVLTAANYVAVRLREIPPMGSLGNADEVSKPPAVQFMAAAMKDKKIVKGFLCHALWLLTPIPQFLKGRTVTCHTVVLADVINAGGIFVPETSHLHIDEDVVTARSAADLEVYCKGIYDTYKKLNCKQT